MKEESKMMSRIVGSLEQLLEKNIYVRDAMSDKLKKIYPKVETTADVVMEDDHNCRDYSEIISELLNNLHSVTEGHKENLKHLNEIV